jgi:hypothetical protein
MKVALIDKNPKTQFAVGNNYPVFTGMATLSKDIEEYKPDWVFISIKHGMEQIRDAIKNTKAAYIYADYNNPLPRFATILSSMSDITVTSWKHPELWRKLKNPHVIRRGTDTDLFFPLPDVKPIYDVVFAGNNIGGKPRLKVLNFLRQHFNLYIIGAGWDKKFNQLGQKAINYKHLNELLNLGKTTVDIFNLYDIIGDGASHYTSNRPYQNMAVGRPHIQPYVPGVEEFFKNGYLNYKSLDNLEYGINRLLEMTQSERDLIGIVQRKEIVTRHTLAHSWKYMEKLIERELFGK